MNKLFITLFLGVTLVSCSEQKFAFRKKISVSQEEQQAMLQKAKRKPKVADQNATVPADQITVETDEPVLADASGPAATGIVTPKTFEEKAPDLTIKSSAEQQKTVTKPKASPKPAEGGSKSGWAIAGFVLSLVGLLIAPLLCGILAIIFGAIALKSSRRGLALAAIIIGIVDIFFALVLISRM
jgi:lipopolysaccharide export LptBFGC system permease protein LptF